jgi:dolichol-phosphate mannosyltransferase
MKDDCKISVILLAYNEKDVIGQFLNDISKTLKDQVDEFEIIVVESGSTDNTAEIVEKLSRKNRHIRLIRQLTREGYGSAMRLGFANAKHDLIFYTDADRALNPKDITRAVSLSHKTDVVLGYRINREEDTFKRRIYSKVYNFMVRHIFGLQVNDVNFSCKLIKRCLLPSLHLRSNGVFIDAELLAEVKRNGYTISEIGVIYLYRESGVSTLSRPSEIIKTLIEMLIYIFNRFFSRN